MVNCFNIECPQYIDQPDCHNSCPLMARALNEAAAPKRPSDFLIFNKKIFGVPLGTILLFNSLSLRPTTIMRETADTRTFRELNEQYRGFTSEPAFRRLSTSTQFVYYKDGLYIPADPNQYRTCPIFLRLLWHKEGDLTAADLVLKTLIDRLHNRRSCADCERVPLDGSLLEVGLQEMLAHLLKEKVSPPVLNAQGMQRTSFTVTQPSIPPDMGNMLRALALQRELENGYSVVVQWPASFPPLPMELQDKQNAGTLIARDILPFLPVDAQEKDIRISPAGVIEIALYLSNGGYNQFWGWASLERVLEREQKRQASE